MRTLSEMDSKLASDLLSAGNSTLFGSARRLELLKSAHLVATAYHEWPDLQRTKTTSTTEDEYYDYPDEFRTDSIVDITIDGQPYDKKNYRDFRKYLIDNASRLQAYTAGLVLDVAGCIQPEQFSETITTTIFSYSDETGNEAIVKLAMADGIKKINPNLALQLQADAQRILDNIWSKVSPRKQNAQHINRPFLKVPDFFGRTRTMLEDDEPSYIFADYQRKIFVASFR